jgi:hypothetical protein
MATILPKSNGHRHWAVRDRSPTYNPKTDCLAKRDSKSGGFMDQKVNRVPFKGVRKEK